MHPRIYVSGDAATTLSNLAGSEMLARWRLVFEMLIVVSQALTAIWFYKLFKDIDHVSAWALASWGMINSGVIMISAIGMGGALDVANSQQILSEKLVMIRLYDQVIRHAWGVGNLFFGLWLLPMGYIVVRSRCMPVWLGRVLLIGGAGYLLSAFSYYLGIRGVWAEMMTVPAAIAEFWMIGYLLIFGIRTQNVFQHSSS